MLILRVVQLVFHDHDFNLKYEDLHGHKKVQKINDHFWKAILAMKENSFGLHNMSTWASHTLKFNQLNSYGSHGYLDLAL